MASDTDGEKIGPRLDCHADGILYGEPLATEEQLNNLQHIKRRTFYRPLVRLPEWNQLRLGAGGASTTTTTTSPLGFTGGSAWDGPQIRSPF